jgi:hypothetical protein
VIGTINLGLNFTVSSDPDPCIETYTDSDWGGDTVDRKSTTGYVIFLNNNPVSWRSKKQTTIALSTCEAEFMALADAISETLYIKSLVGELGGKQNPAIVYEDNQAAIALAKNPVNHSRAKHIDIRFHFIRKHIDDGTIIVKYIPTTSQVADALTKPVTCDAMKKAHEKMNLI